jgi:hypothetical protein
MNDEPGSLQDKSYFAYHNEHPRAFEQFSSLLINPCNQIAFLKASVTTMYYVLVVDKDIVDCNVDL